MAGHTLACSATQNRASNNGLLIAFGSLRINNLQLNEVHFPSIFWLIGYCHASHEVKMSQQAIKDAIANKKILCPTCQSPIKSFDKYAETIDAVRDGLGFTDIDSRGCRVTLICGNGNCPWKERTEFWSQYLID